ncbi:hypothetical protein DKX38_020291 [Salix brachista]|uniref:Uncharacterized protein n=1 Tax=Salix brachista TaxID=2182728 RepID=A0A5N5KIT4_9ROSI|nr:hypothetical protein DKX38_020291 [Salix brachista]
MQSPINNPFDFLKEEIIFPILDYLNNDPFAKVFLQLAKLFTLLKLAIDLSNGVELNDLTTAAIVSNLALKYKEIRSLDLSYLQVEIKVELFDDLNPAAVSRCIFSVRALIKSIIQKILISICSKITEKCLPSILQLQHLEDSVLEGCLGMDDDDGLSTPRQN